MTELDEGMEPTDKGAAAGVARLVEQRFGLAGSVDMQAKIGHVMAAILDETPYADVDALGAALVDGQRADVLESIAAQLIVPETHFFRVGPQIAALRNVVLPDVIRRAESTRRLRVWSAGCSTGEEPYTLAILLREQLAERGEWQVDVVASDLSQRALRAAQAATYGSWSFRDTPHDVRDRYFTPMHGRWRLADDVRRMVRFFPLNLAQPPLWAPEIGAGRFDLIFCRNVTIYFAPDARRRLYGELARLLAPDGWLVLGPSDPAPEAETPLRPRFLSGAVLWRHGDEQTPAPPSQPDAAHEHARRRRTATPHRAAPRVGVAHRPARATTAADSTAASMDPSTHLAGGLGLLDAGDLDAAVTSLRRAVYLDPEDPLAHFTLGRAYFQLGQHARAGVETREALRLLADRADDETAGGVTVAELRLAAAAQFAMLGQAQSRSE